MELATFTLALYALNKLLLSKDTLHTLNRVLWLGTIAISAILPFVITPFKSLFKTNTIVGGSVEVGNIVISEVKAAESAFDWSIVFYIYIAGAVICAIILIYRYIKLLKFLITSTRSQHALLEESKILTGNHKRIKLIVHEGEIAPFSWMNYIVISKQDLNKEILVHELTHSKLGHSYDILFADLFIIFQWFNPAAWLIKTSIQQVHEYQADDAVLNAGTNAKNYQLLLIKKAVGQRLYTMANSFNHSNLKNRITMMSKSKSSKWAVAKCLIALPMSVALLTAFTTPAISNSLAQVSTQESKSTKKSTDNEPIVYVDGKLFSGNLNEIPVDSIESMTVLKGEKAVAKYGSKAESGAIEITLKQGVESRVAQQPANSGFPKFQGGDPDTFSTWVMQNLKYPASAKVDGFECKIVVKYTIKADGSVADVEVLRSTSEGKINNPQAINECSNEALRVVQSSPKWTPRTDENGKAVDITMVIPIFFKLK